MNTAADTRPWARIADQLPPDGVPVLTKIEDEKGTRNVQVLTRRKTLWFVPGESVYVYYTPTHWTTAHARELGTV